VAAEGRIFSMSPLGHLSSALLATTLAFNPSPAPNPDAYVRIDAPLRCSGSLLTPQVAITAAHCLELGVPEDVAVGGLYAGDPDETYIEVLDAVIPEKYTPLAADGDFEWDFALLLLSEPYQNADVPLFGPELPSEAIYGWAGAWGRVSESDPSGVNDGFLWGAIGVVNLNRLYNLGESDDGSVRACRGFVGEGVLCFFTPYDLGGVGQSTCGGDSGSPVMYRPTVDSSPNQVGVVVGGYPDCGGVNVGLPTFAIDLTHAPYREWIGKTVADLLFDEDGLAYLSPEGSCSVSPSGARRSRCIDGSSWLIGDDRMRVRRRGHDTVKDLRIDSRGTRLRSRDRRSR